MIRTLCQNNLNSFFKSFTDLESKRKAMSYSSPLCQIELTEQLFEMRFSKTLEALKVICSLLLRCSFAGQGRVFFANILACNINKELIKLLKALQAI